MLCQPNLSSPDVRTAFQSSAEFPFDLRVARSVAVISSEITAQTQKITQSAGPE